MAEFVIARVEKYADFPRMLGGSFIFLGKNELWCSLLIGNPLPTHEDIAEFAGEAFDPERLVATGTWRIGVKSEGEPVVIEPRRSGTLEWGPGDGLAVVSYVRSFPDIGKHKVLLSE